MKNLNIPVGISDFERNFESELLYVDKTGLIKTLLQGEDGSGDVDHAA